MGLRRSGVSALVLYAALATAAPAQRTTDYGVMVGGSFSKLRGSDGGNFGKTKVGLSGGGFVTLGVTPALALQGEVFFAQKGGNNEAADVALKLSYLEIPVLLKLRIPAKGNGSQFSPLSPHLYGGGALGIKSGCTVKSGTTTTTCQSFGAEIKSTEFSLVLGAGVDIGRAMIDLRFDLGLSTIDSSGTDQDVRTGTFYLLAGWTFRPPR